MMHISFYVPKSHAEKVKEAMFRAGGGKLGNYEHCSFEFEGIGQFRPMPGSAPFIGSEGELERVNEVKVEMVCEASLIKAVINALRSAHPYETPAYYVTETVRI